jgi:hypothetical protein
LTSTARNLTSDILTKVLMREKLGVANIMLNLWRNLPHPHHSHTPHFRAGRGQLHPMLGAPYCIARHRHPDAAQAWHSAACVRDCNCSIVLVFKMRIRCFNVQHDN